MNLSGLVLVIPEKADSERDAVARVWQGYGGLISRLGRFWEPPEFEPSSVRVYGNDTFSLVLEQKLDLELVSPEDDLLVKVPKKYLKRTVKLVSLEDARKEKFPQFMKSAAPKIFRAAVYENVEELNNESKNLENSTLVLVSDIVEVESEARCFVLEGEILDCSIYEGHHSEESALEFAQDAVANINLPSTCVLDVGYFKGLGWGIIEFNATWGSGLNGCSAKKVFAAIEHATRAKNT